MEGILSAVSDIILASDIHNFMIDRIWLFPAAETLHYMSLTLFFGALLVVDLRGMGYLPKVSFAAAHQLIPVAVVAFAFIVLSGITFVIIDPARYFVNVAFQLKMALILVAGMNAMWFEFFIFRAYAAGDKNIESAYGTKLVSGLSLLIWASVMILGRSIPYVET